MLTIEGIRQNKEDYTQRLLWKNFDVMYYFDDVLLYDKHRREFQQTRDELQHQVKTLTNSIGDLMKSGKNDEIELIKENVKLLKDVIKELDEYIANLEDKTHEILVKIPNVPHHSVPRCGNVKCCK